MVEEGPTQFLDGLPESTPQYEFVSIDDFYEKLAANKQAEGSDSFTPMLVSVNMLEEGFQEMTSSKTELMSQYIFAYSHPHRCIILGTLTEIHQFIKDSFANLIDEKTTEMGLCSEMLQAGNTARTYGSVTKQPDAQWIPTRARGRVPDPTLLLEVGQARSERRLEEDAKRWLTYLGTPIFNVVQVRFLTIPRSLFRSGEVFISRNFGVLGNASRLSSAVPMGKLLSRGGVLSRGIRH